MRKICDLPNGHELFVEPNEVGANRYWSGEVPPGTFVWDTALVDKSTLLAAIVEEQRAETETRHERMVKGMTLCVHCKWYAMGACNNPSLIDPVSGNPQKRIAGDVRADHNLCGREGRWYEADTTRFESQAPGV